VSIKVIATSSALSVLTSSKASGSLCGEQPHRHSFFARFAQLSIISIACSDVSRTPCTVTHPVWYLTVKAAPARATVLQCPTSEYELSNAPGLIVIGEVRVSPPAAFTAMSSAKPSDLQPPTTGTPPDLLLSSCDWSSSGGSFTGSSASSASSCASSGCCCCTPSNRGSGSSSGSNADSGSRPQRPRLR